MAAGVLLILALPAPPTVAAQLPGDTLRLGMDDAVRIALERNPALRLSRLDVDAADAKVRETRGSLLPQVGSSTGFTRDIISTNPFAGTRALGQLGGQAPTGWLFFNEQARTDCDPQTQPIPLDRFQERQEQAFQREGISAEEGGANPFAVPNQFQAGLSLQQPLWDPGAAARVRGLRAARSATVAGTRRQLAVTVDSTRQAYLAALLARERAGVFARSVERTRTSAEESAHGVEAGVAPVFERLSAEVELGNLRTELIERRKRRKRSPASGSG
jgi:outer membrane protein TolC